MAGLEQAEGPHKTNNAAILYGIEDLVRDRQPRLTYTLVAMVPRASPTPFLRYGHRLYTRVAAIARLVQPPVVHELAAAAQRRLIPPE